MAVLFSETQRDTWGHKKMAGLPMFAGQTRHSTEARSAWRERLLTWLKSEDGRLWKENREERLHPQDENVPPELAEDV